MASERGWTFAICDGWCPPSSHKRPRFTKPFPRSYVVLRSRLAQWDQKVEAACRFVEAGGQVAGIGALADAVDILAGRSGTLIRRSPAAPVKA